METEEYEVIEPKEKGKFKKYLKYLFYFVILALLVYLLYKWIINPFIITPISQVSEITKTQKAMKNTDVLILDSLGSIQSDMATIADALNTLSINDSTFNSKLVAMDTKIDKNHKANVDGWVGLMTNVVAPLYKFDQSQTNFWVKEIRKCPNAYKKIPPLVWQPPQIKNCDDPVSVTTGTIPKTNISTQEMKKINITVKPIDK
jgi:hypothetical protein